MEALRFPLNPFSHFGHVRVRRLEQATPRPAGRFVRDRVDLTGFARPAAAYCLIKPQSSQSEGRTSGRRILVAVGEEHHAKDAEHAIDWTLANLIRKGDQVHLLHVATTRGKEKRIQPELLDQRVFQQSASPPMAAWADRVESVFGERLERSEVISNGMRCTTCALRHAVGARCTIPHECFG